MIFKNYVMGLIYDDIGRVLLIKKNRPKHQVGKWNGVGGKIEEGESDIHFDNDDFNRICEERYYQALEKGVKPQEARRVIPQSAYTQIWGAFMPNQLDNYLKLRLHKTAQWEIQQTAIAMQELIK